MNMKLEVVVLPISDVDRAKRFYRSLRWRLDADFVTGENFRVEQLTPPRSECSIIFGKVVTSAVPGSVQGLHLVVSDIEAPRAELVGRSVDVSELLHDVGEVFTTPGSRDVQVARIQNVVATARSPPSVIRTVTVGCSKR